MGITKGRVDMEVMYFLPHAHENFFDTERRRAVDEYFRSEDERLGRNRQPVETRAQRRARVRTEAKRAAKAKAGKPNVTKKAR